MKRLLCFMLVFALSIPSVSLNAADQPGNTGGDPNKEKDPKGMICPSVNLFGEILFTKVCWSCMLPIQWGGASLFSGDPNPPPGANDDYFCACSGDTAASDFGIVGLALGMWQPTRIVEVVRKPYCYPALWGADMQESITKKEALRFGGKKQIGQDEDGVSYYEAHMYAYPLLNILQMLDAPKCTVDYHATYDLLFMSEVFPHWSNDNMAFLINPEAALFANPVAQLASIPDCVSATVTDNGPFDEIFWEMGCWGSTYPLTGSELNSMSHNGTSSLIATKFMFLLGRMGMLKRTVGKDTMCKAPFMPIMQKSQYKMQQLWPVPESGKPAEIANQRSENSTDSGLNPTLSNNCDGQTDCIDVNKLPDKCCHFIGTSTYAWGEHRKKAGTGEDFIYLIWQWVDCCVGVIGA